jgi:hypothetical protein
MGEACLVAPCPSGAGAGSGGSNRAWYGRAHSGPSARERLARRKKALSGTSMGGSQWMRRAVAPGQVAGNHAASAYSARGCVAECAGDWGRKNRSLTVSYHGHTGAVVHKFGPG